MAAAAAQYGLHHVLHDLNIYRSIVEQAINNGNQAAAQAAMNTLVTNAQLVQTAINASTNATLTTAMVSYTPPDGVAGY